MKNLFKKLSLLALMMFITIGFSSNAFAQTSNGSNASNSSNSSNASEFTKVTFPYTFTGVDGKSVVIEKAPEKIVSLSPTFTEVLFEIGVGNKVVGRTDYCDYPEQTKDIPSVGSMTKPSIEKIVELKPDVVFVSFLKAEVVEQIEKAGVKVIQIPNGDSFEGSYKNMREIAKITDSQAKAEEVILKIKKDVKEVEDKLKGATKVKTYYVAGFGEGGDFTSGDKTFINDIINAAGGDNVAKDAQGWKYTQEKLVEKNPEFILIGKMAGAENFKKTAPYSNLDAVKNNKVIEVEDNLINREGPRMGEAVKMVAKVLHPDLFK